MVLGRRAHQRKPVRSAALYGPLSSWPDPPRSKAGLDFKQTPWEVSFPVQLTAPGTRQSQGTGSPFDPCLQLRADGGEKAAVDF